MAITHSTRQGRYSALMTQAAGGSRAAAESLLTEGFLPGEARFEADVERVREYAIEMGYLR